MFGLLFWELIQCSHKKRAILDAGRVSGLVTCCNMCPSPIARWVQQARKNRYDSKELQASVGAAAFGSMRSFQPVSLSCAKMSFSDPISGEPDSAVELARLAFGMGIASGLFNRGWC